MIKVIRDPYAGFQDPNTVAIYTRPSDAEFYPGTMAHEYRHFTDSDERNPKR